MRLWPNGKAWWPHPRIQVQAPQWQRDVIFCVWKGHTGDEYGNCGFRFVTGLTGGITVFPFPHFQRDVEVPEPGECAWTDRVYWPEYFADGLEELLKGK